MNIIEISNVFISDSVFISVFICHILPDSVHMVPKGCSHDMNNVVFIRMIAMCSNVNICLVFIRMNTKI